VKSVFDFPWMKYGFIITGMKQIKMISSYKTMKGIFKLHLRQDRNGSVPMALELTRIKMP
jgi:hypothetical protein